MRFRFVGVYKIKTIIYTCNFRLLLQVLVRMVPSREKIGTSLKKDSSLSNEELLEDMKEALVVARTNTAEINRFYTLRGQHSMEKSKSLQFAP